eukprot:TRINITY_DN959_c0_g2_i1.p1 TRINITY_DN959_c0_g2~~TRINITY_DN959_c0_g2_i1.p1  ORF type:complete len:400 (+),score=87.35 TRINITY_DN959_c0_g2_i1:102-1301(+)
MDSKEAKEEATTQNNTERAEENERAEEHSLLIRKCAIVAELKSVPSDIFTGGFTDNVFSKIDQILQQQNAAPEMKEQALAELCLVLKKPTNVESVLNSNLLFTLLITCTDSTVNVRRCSTQALDCLCASRHGRETMIKANFIPSIMNLLNDSDAQVRLNAYSFLAKIARQDRKGLDMMIEQDLVDILITKCGDEKEAEVKAAALSLLCDCIQQNKGYKAAFDGGIIEMLVKVLKEPQLIVLPHACRCIAYASVLASGKIKAVEAGSVPIVVPLIEFEAKDDKLSTPTLTEITEQTHEYSSLFLMHIANLVAGKVEAIKSGAVALCLAHIDSGKEKDVVKVNCAQALCSLTEHPQSKLAHAGLLTKELSIGMLEKLKESSKSSLVRQSLETALKRIYWKP